MLAVSGTVANPIGITNPPIDDLLAIAHEEIEDEAGVYQLDYLSVTAGTSTVPTATVRLRRGQELIQDATCGDGTVDASLKTIERITGVGSSNTLCSLPSMRKRT